MCPRSSGNGSAAAPHPPLSFLSTHSHSLAHSSTRRQSLISSSPAPQRSPSRALCGGATRTPARAGRSRPPRAWAAPPSEMGRGRLCPPTDGGTPPAARAPVTAARRDHDGEELATARGRARGNHGHGGEEKAALALFVAPPRSSVGPVAKSRPCVRGRRSMRAAAVVEVIHVRTAPGCICWRYRPPPCIKVSREPPLCPWLPCGEVCGSLPAAGR
jgi:hypothetical protein